MKSNQSVFAIAMGLGFLVLYPQTQYAAARPVATLASSPPVQASGAVGGQPLSAGQLLSIQTPSQGNRLVGESVEFSIAVSTSADLSTLEVDLNGSPVTNQFQVSSCTSEYCTETSQISSSQGLMNGKNGLTATVLGPGGAGDSARVRFDWYEQANAQAVRSLPPSVAFETVSLGGGSPWFRIAGRDFPSSNYCYHDTMQVVDLDRYELSQKDYRCFNDAASLNNYLKTMTQNDLVVAGTTGHGKLAFPGLNTTAIGGTNYTNTSDFPTIRYPHWYMIVGVGGAPAGQAYESYSVQYTAGHPYQYWPWAHGMLSEDSKFAYNFHSSDRRVFQVIPNDPKYNASSIRVGWQLYTAPAVGDGFWVLMLDRVLLQPIDSKVSGAPCRYDQAFNQGTCGRFFPTGSSDSGTASRAISDLASFLSDNQYRRNLIFLTSNGRALTAQAKPNDALFRAINALGGSGYVLMNLASASSPAQTYTLVSAHDHNYHTALLGKAVFSSSLLANQGQTGRIRGLLTQNHFALFSPIEFAQDSAAEDAKGNQADYSFEQVVVATPQPWPYSGSAGHMAAYRYLSYELIHSYLQNPSGDHLDDIRYYYTGSQNITIANGQRDPTTFPYPGDGKGFTQQEWSETAVQLQKEKGYLRQLINFFGNATSGTGMGGVIANGSSSVTLSLLGAANDVKRSTLNPNTDNTVRLDSAAVISLALGLIQLGQNFAGPYAPAVGLVSGIIEIATTLAGGLQTGGIPNPEYGFTSTLGQLINNTNSYLSNMQSSYNTSLDSIYSDWYKLDTAGRKVVQTGSGGWYYDTQASYGAEIRVLMNKAVQRSTYFQLMRHYYGVDYWPNNKFSSYDKILSIYSRPGIQPACLAFYADNKAPAAAASTLPSPGGRDIFVIAGQIRNNRNYNVSEDNVPVALVNVLLGNGSSDLNIPRELFLGPLGPLPYREGAAYSGNFGCP
jgi:hypothetical protein